MSVPRKQYLYSLERGGKFLYYDVNAVIPSAQYVWLPENPDGWKDIQIAFGTNQKYFSLNRSFSVPLKLVGDGAEILRYYQYKGKGYEEDINVRILKWNEQFTDIDGKEGRYELVYLGKIDFTKMKDDPLTSFQVNTIEGGVLAYLNANDGVSYPLKCNPDHPDAFPVLFDGIDLDDTYNYVLIDIDLPKYNSPLPVGFISNEGDSVGVIGQTGQQIENNPSPTNFDYYLNSSNYLFQSVHDITLNVKGTLQIINNGGGSNSIFTSEFISQFSVRQTIIPFGAIPLGLTSVDFDFNLNLVADEKLFFTYAETANGPAIHLAETKISISFKSRNDNSIAFFRDPLSILKELVSLMSGGKYTADSNFFATHKNLSICGGESLREQKDTVTGKLNGVLKTTFQDFFTDYNGDYNLGVKIVNNVLFVEPKGDLYNDSSQIFDVGDISELTVNVADEYLINSIKVGSAAQTYDERNGKYEFSGTDEFKAPVNNGTTKKDYNIVGKYRRDPYGIEFYRGKLNNKDTTDNKGDNDVFKVNVVPQAQFTGAFNILWDASLKTLRLTGQAANISFFTVGKSFLTVTSDLPDFNFFLFTVVSATIVDGSDLDIVTEETAPAVTASFTGSITFPYKLKRVVYDSAPVGIITPNIDGPGALFNIEEMTPKRQLLAHGNYLRSLLYQLPGEKITFQTGDKNTNLSTTLNGVTIKESSDIVVSKLSQPIFLPYEIDFTTKVPYAFAKLMSRITAGYIKGTYNNFQLYFLPIGEMKSKPVTDEAQEWKLLAAPMTSLDTLQKLSQGTFIQDATMNNQLFISDYNPVHFVRYNYQTPGKYHYKGIYDDRFEDRQARYDSKQTYYQKWQTTDTIPLQFVVVGYGQIEIKVYDGSAQLIDTLPMVIMSDTSVFLPYIKQQLDIDLSTYGAGCYQLVATADGVNIAISEWQQVSVDLPNTALHEYYHTKNKPNAYFKQWRPQIRIETYFMKPTPESTSTTYEDDGGDTETLSAEDYMKQKIILGDGFGLPDYLIKKLNKIFLLNQLFIEGTQYTRVSGGKMEVIDLEGYPMDAYTVELRESNPNEGLIVSDNSVSINNPGVSSYTIDAESIGQGTGTIEIEANG